MAVVGVGSITLFDHNEMLYALLVSDAGLVPVNASGTPINPLSTTPLTTRMHVYRGSVLETGWTFSRTQSNATSSINSTTGVLTVTAVSADSAYVDITATKSGEPSLTKRFNITKVYQGNPGDPGEPGDPGAPGEPAYGVRLEASSQIVIISSRGAFKTKDILFTAILNNLPIANIQWARSDGGTLQQVEISEGVYDPYRRMMDCTDVVDFPLSVTISLAYGGITYTSSVDIGELVEGIPAPMPLGAVSEVPEGTSEGPLVYGDHFTWDAVDSGIYLWGHSYVYHGLDATGTAIWEETENFTHLSNLAEVNIAMSKRTGVITHSRVIFSEYIFATKIIVLDELVANYKEYTADDVGNTIEGHLVVTTDVGRPYKGVRIGVDGKVKGVDAVFWNTILYGLIKSDALDTQNESVNATPFPAVAPALSLWNEKAFYDNIPLSESVTLASFAATWGGQSITHGTKLKNSHIQFFETSGHHVGVGTEHSSSNMALMYTYDVPSTFPTGQRFDIDLGLHIDGWDMWVSTAFIWDRNGVRYTQGKHTGNDWDTTLCDVRAGDQIRLYGYRNTNIGWGYADAYVRYFRLRTYNVFDGVIFRTSNNTLIQAMQYREGVYYSLVWSCSGWSTSSIVTKRSGTPIVTAYATQGQDFVQASGTVVINGVSWAVDRVRRTGDTVVFGSGANAPEVTRFIEGTSVGAYAGLSVTAVNIYAQIAAALVKNLIPKDHGIYDLGQSNVVTPGGLVQRFFRHLFLTGNADVGGYVDGSSLKSRSGVEIYHPSTPFIDFHYANSTADYTSRIIEEVSGRLAVMGDFRFGGKLFAVPTLEYPSNTSAGWSNVSKTISAMSIGERKVFRWTHTCSYVDEGTRTMSVICPSGGTYFAFSAKEPTTFNRMGVVAGGASVYSFNLSSGAHTVCVYIVRLS